MHADVLARQHRVRGEDVRFLSGTDDDSLENVDAAGVPVAEFAHAKAERFAAPAGPLAVPYGDFIGRASTLFTGQVSSAYGVHAPRWAISTSAPTHSSGSGPGSS